MNTAKKINISADAAQPSYMHRAVIFKRNPQRDIMHGIKLWDIPIDMKKTKNKNTILGMKSSIMDTVNLKKHQKTKYKNATVPMEQVIEVEASSSKSTINTNETEENSLMEISVSKKAMPERNFQKENENTKKTRKRCFITIESNKEEDNISILLTDTNLSEHEKWRIETNAKRYKAWIKGKNNTEKTNYLLDEIKNKEIQWINLSREKNLNKKGVHLTLTFNNEEDLQKILQLNLEFMESNKKIKIT
ncbi:hypothetical protein Glove_155g138 [Diversispora epigaea]|uniref:Uncharacterized protein n=1 Tax=Diversispora epigaea TaxID=1348612 RepID=A0A397J1S4_9GLOM|nr:hypothetical protein Glove_155g138 [Diversispora epigaea]